MRPPPSRPATQPSTLRRLLPLLPLICLLAACGGGTRSRLAYDPSGRTYPEPGPPGDPWKPYIEEASGRFSVPRQWIRAVMHQESGGHEYMNGQPITSGAGAMGLMQLMPATYAELQDHYGLGSDPYEPHDNIMAGTAYISQMYRKYGAPAFLAAYNAGPQRLEDYLAGRSRLPNETVNYVASIAPNLGTEIAMTGPLAAYASGGTAPDYASPAYATPTGAPIQLASARVRRRRGGGRACWHDPDAAYDPDAPCQSPPAAAPMAPAVVPAMAYASARPSPARSAACWHDPDAAYDPDAPCQAPPPAPVEVASAPPVGSALGGTMPASYSAPVQARPIQTAAIQPAYATPAYATPAYAAPAALPRSRPAIAPAAVLPAAQATGPWAIQVGAFNSVNQARFATTMARQAAFNDLAGSQSVVQSTTPFGGSVLYRARLAGLAHASAGNACAALRAQNIPCMVVAPGG
jgi:D-alanyl-D-alanine carboxypeptidase